VNEVLFVILRRLRRPLIVLIIAYTASVWGLVLIPGMDKDGSVVHLGFFHALYIISYTATTIGFGEIPYEFTDAQRAWTIVCIYSCVVSWAYALGSVFHLSQDQTFRDAVARRRFALRVAAMQESFVLIVGYGQSGIMLSRMLDRMGQRMVIIETRRDRAGGIEISEFEYPPLFLAADGRLPDVLVDAGVTHRKCVAMVALAGDDDTNQSVAIGGTVLNPSLRIIARVHTQIAQANLESFRNIELINPFRSFANNINLDLGSPEKLRVIEWLSGLPGAMRPDSLNFPKGHWVVCGKGSFAHYVCLALEAAGVSWAIVEYDFAASGSDGSITRQGSALDDLLSAGIERAVGLVACTESDSVNLATVTRARSVNAGLYVIIRQVNVANASLIDASMAPLRFLKAEVVSHKVRQLLTSPLLIRFLRYLEEDVDDLAHRAGALLETQVGERVPFMWVFDCYLSYAGLREALAPDVDPPLSIGDLLINPENPPERLAAVPLLLMRDHTETPLPAEDGQLLPGDRILFAGQRGVEELQRRFFLEPSPLVYVRTGIEPPRSWLFRHLLQQGKTKPRGE
jgi:Trk K+ transport system NAD-binding subunit